MLLRLFQSISKGIEHIISMPFFVPCSLFLIFTIGALLRFYCYWQAPLLSRDAVGYLEISELWLHGGWYAVSQQQASWVPPFLPWAVMKGMQWGFSGDVVGVLLNLIAGSLLPIVMFFLGKSIFRSASLGLVAAIFIACAPSCVELSTQFQRESLYLLFVALSLLSVVVALRKDSLLPWLFGGVFFSVAVLTRYEALELLFIVIVFCVVASIYGGWSVKKSIGVFGVWVCGASVGIIIMMLIMRVGSDYLTMHLFLRLKYVWS